MSAVLDDDTSRRLSQLKRRGLMAGAAALAAGVLGRLSARTALAADGQALMIGQANTQIQASRTNMIKRDHIIGDIGRVQEREQQDLRRHT